MFPDAMINFHYCFYLILFFFFSSPFSLSFLYSIRTNSISSVRTEERLELLTMENFYLSLIHFSSLCGPLLSACSKLCSDITFIELFEKMK